MDLASEGINRVQHRYARLSALSIAGAILLVDVAGIILNDNTLDLFDIIVGGIIVSVYVGWGVFVAAKKKNFRLHYTIFLGLSSAFFMIGWGIALLAILASESPTSQPAVLITVVAIELIALANGWVAYAIDK